MSSEPQNVPQFPRGYFKYSCLSGRNRTYWGKLEPSGGLLAALWAQVTMHLQLSSLCVSCLSVKAVGVLVTHRSSLRHLLSSQKSLCRSHAST